MASQSLSRKRPAPGTSPAPYQTSYRPPPAAEMGSYGGFDPQVSNDQFLQFGYQPPIENPQSPRNGGATQQPQPQLQLQPQPQRPQSKPSQNVDATSNQLTRMPPNQIVSRGRVYGDSNDPQWTETESRQRLEGAWSDGIDDLKRRAQLAKRDAQAKRKQIPPFIQKLASFLDDGNNTNLIRWSDDGNSFIVEDEDEFAKKLIPELFKHNNYTSFVRQLNMYGFHKKVGLSDNSMRASEKKAKSPSEYSNPYFRRGHPDLLWLIQKPKNAGQTGKAKGSKRTEPDQNEDDNDDYVEEILPAPPTGTNPGTRLAIGQGKEEAPVEQFKMVQQELQAIRHQQTRITAMIQRLKREHEQLYGQAANFQDQHSRHENSINAILTFLATVYNRSLQGHEGVQGIANIFTGAMSQDNNQSHVVDVGDFTFDQLNGADGTLQRPFKKQPLLLKAPPTEGGTTSTASPSPADSPYAGRQTRGTSQRAGNGANQPRIVEDLLELQNQLQQPQSAHSSSYQNQRDILSVIHNTNARTTTPGTPAPDFSNVLNSLEHSGGNSPLTNTQRADMLRLIHNQGSASNAGDSALTTPIPPTMPNDYDHRLAATKSDLENLAKMQAEQDRSVQNLTNLLQPLSPTGSIPGLGDSTDVHPPPLDIDDFLNNSANYFAEFPSDPNFGFNGTDVNVNHGSTNGINFADLDDGDDELFGDVGRNNNNNNNNDNGANNGLATKENNGYDYLNVDSTADDGGGRVESMASSEGASPTNTIATVDGDGPTTRSRANAVFEEEQQQQQQQQQETQSGSSPARKRKRLG